MCATIGISAPQAVPGRVRFGSARAPGPDNGVATETMKHIITLNSDWFRRSRSEFNDCPFDISCKFSLPRASEQCHYSRLHLLMWRVHLKGCAHPFTHIIYSILLFNFIYIYNSIKCLIHPRLIKYWAGMFVWKSQLGNLILGNVWLLPQWYIYHHTCWSHARVLPNHHVNLPSTMGVCWAFHIIW